jgi:uncharacterized membrane protein YdbT with pleckstrin-like domain
VSYVDKNLNEGETVVFRTTLHPIVYAGAVICALLAVVFVSQRATREIGYGLFALTAIVAFFIWLWRATSEFAVTTSRVIIKIGWLNQRTVELQLSKVEGVTVEQGLTGRMFDYGSIVVGGTGGTKEPFALIRAPIKFRRHVQQQIDANAAVANVPIAVAAGVREERECPSCAERILVRATRCRFCGQEVQPA